MEAGGRHEVRALQAGFKRIHICQQEEEKGLVAKISCLQSEAARRVFGRIQELH